MPQPYIDFGYVKEHASFERVIAGYNLKLLGTGPQRTLLCPFRRERKPSCKIELERNIWHCFGCDAKGNILEFVARLEGDEEDLRGAALKIAEICQIPTATPRDSDERPEHKRPWDARRRRIAKAWADSKPEARTRGQVKAERRLANDNSASEHSPAREEPINPSLRFELKLDPSHPYLAARGFSPEVIAEFGLGFCSRGLMAGRICIPIHDADGQLVAYAGRWAEDEPPEAVERYKLPPKFEKSRVLYNLHRVADAGHVVLVEGYWSAIRLHSFGIPVAALMGWSVSEMQIALLQTRGTQFITLLLDGDETGRRGRERVLPDLAGSFFVRAPLLADGHKPDTLGESELRELVVVP